MATNYRSIHKAALKTLIESITYTDPVNSLLIDLEGKVLTEWSNKLLSDVQINISTGATTEFQLLDTCSYDRRYQYDITVSLPILEKIKEEAENSDIYREKELDILESEIIALLLKQSTRDTLVSGIIDVTVLDVTAPIVGGTIEVTNSHIFKVITVEIRVINAYDKS